MANDALSSVRDDAAGRQHRAEVIGRFRNLAAQNQNDGNSLRFNPLFLSNSDSPGMTLVSVPFDGSNFPVWSRNLKLALGSKMKLGFINGSCPKPDSDSEDFDLWERCDNMVMSWIINSMVKDVAQNFVYANSARELWDEIVERFSESNAPLIYQIHREINNMRQENLSVLMYYNQLKKLWDQLQSIEGIPYCACGAITQCGCGLMKRILDRDTTMKMMQFLMGLSDQYDGVRSTILSTDPLPTLSRAYQMVVQIEKKNQITGMGSSSTDALAVNRAGNMNQNRNMGQSYGGRFNTNNNNSGSYGNNGSRYGGDRNYERDSSKDPKKQRYDRKCDFCQEMGHLKESCFRLVGYPEWWKGPRFDRHGKALNTIQEDYYESPLDNDEMDGSRQDTSSLVNAVVNEVMKKIKGKLPADEGSSNGSKGPAVNFAGPFY